jgi:hypothetical protein
MTDSLKIQGEVSLDSSDAEQALGRVEQRAGKMAQSVKQSGQDAGKGVAAIGDGAAGAAQKVDRSASSLIASIQRTTAAMEAGGKSSAAYYEAIAKQRGIDPNVLRPYIDALRQAEEQQKKTSSTLGQVGNSAEKTAQQLRQVAPQVTDIVTQLAGGQAPLQILIQQGGQLKDVFGGIGPAAKALGGYVLGLVSPTTLLIGGVAALGAAYVAGKRETEEFNKALILSGNSLGLTTTLYANLRGEIGGIATQGKAAEVLTQIASAGSIAVGSVRQISEAAILMEKATGQATDKTIAHFVDLAKSPAEAAAKLNEQYNFLTAATYRQIKAFEDQGRTSDAAKLATDAYAEAVHTRAQAIIDDAGLIEKAWREVVIAINNGIDAAKNIGRPDSTAIQLEQVRRDIEAKLGNDANRPGGPLFGPSLDELREQEKRLQHIGEIEAGNAIASAENARQTKAETDWQKIVESNLTKQQQLQREITRIRNEGANAGKSEVEIQQQINLAKQRFNDISGATDVAAQRAAKDQAQAELARIQQAIANLDFSTPTKLTDAEKRVILIQEQLKEGLMGVARANKERELAAAQAAVQDEKTRTGAEKQLELLKQTTQLLHEQANSAFDQALAIRQQADEQEAANSVFGRGKVAVEELRLAQMRATLAQIDASDNADPKYIAGLQFKIEQQERYVQALQKAADKQLAFNSLRLTEANQRDTDLLQYELSIVGQVADVRALLIERRRIELEYAQRIAEIDRADGSEAGKAEARRVAEQQKIVALSNATTAAVLDQWQRASDEISDSLTSAFTDAFENGSNLGKNLVQALKREFSNLVLRPTIQAAISSTGITSLLGQTAGNGNALGSLMSNGSSLMSLAGSNSGWLSSISSLFGGGGTAAASTITAGSTAAETLAAIQAEQAAAGVVGGVGTATAATGAGATAAGAGALASIPVAGWIALGAMLDMKLNSKAGISPAWSLVAPGIGVGMMIGEKLGIIQAPGGPKTEGGTGGPGTPSTGDTQTAQQYASAIAAMYSGAAGMLGLTNTINPGVFFSQDTKGTALTQLEVHSANYDRGSLYGTVENVGRSDQEFKDALTRAGLQDVFSELKAAIGKEGLTGTLADLVNSIDPVTASVEQMQTALQQVQNIGPFEKAIAALGPQFQALSTLSAASVEGLANMAGGMQNLLTELGNFYNDFTSPDVKRQDLAKAIADTLTKGGIAQTATDILNMTRDSYGTAVRNAISLGDAGKGTLATLLSVESLVNQLLPATDNLATSAATAAAAVTSVADNLANIQKNLEGEWAEITARQTARVQAIGEAQAAVFNGITSGFEAIRSSIKDMIDKIRGDITGEQAQATSGGSLQQQFQQALMTVMAGGKGAQAAGSQLPQLAALLESNLTNTATSQLDLLTQQAGIAQHLQDANQALQAQQYIDLHNAYASFSGGSVPLQYYQPRSVADYSSRGMAEQLAILNRRIERMHTAIEAVASHTKATSTNTLKALREGVPALADPSA